MSREEENADMFDTLAQCMMVWLAVNAIVVATVLGSIHLRRAWRIRTAS